MLSGYSLQQNFTLFPLLVMCLNKRARAVLWSCVSHLCPARPQQQQQSPAGVQEGEGVQVAVLPMEELSTVDSLDKILDNEL